MRPSDFFRLFLLAAIWGSSFLFMRFVVPHVGVIATSFFRELLGALGLGAVLIVTRSSWNFEGKATRSLLLGVINSAIPFILFSLAARVLPAGYSAIFNATTPLMAVMIGTAFFGESLNWQKSFGVVLGLLGVVVLTSVGPLHFGWPEFAATLACLASAACYGIAGYLAQHWIYKDGDLDSKLVAFGSQTGATLLMVPLFTYGVVSGNVSIPVQLRQWLALAALGLGCSTAAYILYFRLIADIGALRSSSVTFLVPLFGVVFGAVFLGETLSLGHLYGGGLIAFALWLVLRRAPLIKQLVVSEVN
ncbi:DMT family transporter [Glaciimonas immobilis]|uniref:Drug/metabolite transporter (DMT)-like permease n=1 Tax=Glaciimonas immobilis TaxID=728004 RepID=A0A840RXN2_9BURK|nr:DMT family transporter [Glaciimonas immobilis]KAF3995940.1 EamA family transporter [Glaciimonas immobilis]MBB5202675.1 drug/metabolite transporter (DMT)-like permease [Glaciimonas immobilis]